MGRTRDPFKEIVYIKGIFHERMGPMKERNGKDLTETETIRKRSQKYTELYKKGIMIKITMMVWSHT